MQRYSLFVSEPILTEHLRENHGEVGLGDHTNMAVFMAGTTATSAFTEETQHTPNSPPPLPNRAAKKVIHKKGLTDINSKSE